MKARNTIWNITALALLGVLAFWVSIPQHPCLCSLPETSATNVQERSHHACKDVEHGSCCESETPANDRGMKPGSCCCSNLRTAFLQSVGLRKSKQPVLLKLAFHDGYKYDCTNGEPVAFVRISRLEIQNDCLKQNKLYLLNRALLI